MTQFAPGFRISVLVLGASAALGALAPEAAAAAPPSTTQCINGTLFQIFIPRFAPEGTEADGNKTIDLLGQETFDPEKEGVLQALPAPINLGIPCGTNTNPAFQAWLNQFFNGSNSVTNQVIGALGGSGGTGGTGGATVPSGQASLPPLPATGPEGSLSFLQTAQAGTGTSPLSFRRPFGPDSMFALWAGSSFGQFHDSRGDFDSRFVNVQWGIDYRLNEAMLIGLGMGWEHSRFGAANGRTEGSGFLIGPYIGYKPVEWLTLDLWAGGGFFNYNQTNTGAVGNYGATRAFVSVNATGHWFHGPWRVEPKFTFFYAAQTQNSFTSTAGQTLQGTTARLGRVSFGGEIGYSFAVGGMIRAIEPFVMVRGDYDLEGDRTFPATGGGFFTVPRLGGAAGGGVNLAANHGLAGRIAAGYYSIGRSGQSSWIVDARVSWQF